MKRASRRGQARSCPTRNVFHRTSRDDRSRSIKHVDDRGQLRESGSVTSSPAIKPTAIPRAGYDYQDLVGIELLIRFFRDPDLFQWVTLESDDPETRSLDEVVALRSHGCVELLGGQILVERGRYPLNWY